MPTISPVSNRRVDLAPNTPGLIETIAPGSLAMELGLEAGDRVVAINGQTLVDALDFQFQAQANQVCLEVDRAGVALQYKLNLEGDEYWGVTFADPTFDGVRICENACPFCFIKQIPRGMRRSLYVMDDDYRYSMLYGGFVTLTNLSEEDWRRIEEQRISPLHVSVHSTNPDLRVALVGNPKAGQIMEDLARLERAGIDFHAQLVLCPGINDREELDRSLRDLATFGPRLLSIAGVPVGLSRHGQARQSKQIRLSRTCMRLLSTAQIQVRRYESAEAVDVISQTERWQAKFRRERGSTLFHLGDEFYLMTGLPVPSTAIYDGFPQIEDGIGMTRSFLDRLKAFVSRTQPNTLNDARGTVACGTLVGPTMIEAVRRFNNHTGAQLNVIPVVNNFLGPEITVSGLLAGQDLAAALEDDPVEGPLYISDAMISDRTGSLLDDWTLDQLKNRLGRPVIVAGQMHEVARDLKLRTRMRRAA